jgi:hypothetical protein
MHLHFAFGNRNTLSIGFGAYVDHLRAPLFIQMS